MGFNATEGRPADTAALAAWLWDRLRSAGTPVALGALVREARAAGLWPEARPGEAGPKLGAFYRAKRWVAVAHPGSHVAEVDAPRAGGKASKSWALAAGPDPEAGFDFEAIRRAHDLRRAVEAAWGPPLKGGRWACRVHGGQGPNFAVKGERWRCYKCGASGDVVDFVAFCDRLGRGEAAAQLDPSRTPRRTVAARPSVPPEPEPERDAPFVGDVEWQAAVDGAVCRAEAALWSSEGSAALDWLRSRGLDDETVRRFRLGFVPRPFASDPVAALGPDGAGKARRVWVPRGVTIPWVRPGAWYSRRDGDPGPRWVGLNVRRLPDGEPSGPLPPGQSKYQAVAGSERGHGYPWPETGAGSAGAPALVCEGEFDALVAWQEVGWLVNVATFGGAGQGHGALRPDARAFLAACSDWLLLFDHDDAGDRAARAWADAHPRRCLRLYLPPGHNDLNDLHRSGASVSGWLRSEWERFGWSVPSALTARDRPGSPGS